MEMLFSWSLLGLAVGSALYHIGVWRGKSSAVAAAQLLLAVQSDRITEMEATVHGVAVSLMELRSTVGPVT